MAPPPPPPAGAADGLVAASLRLALSQQSAACARLSRHARDRDELASQLADQVATSKALTSRAAAEAAQAARAVEEAGAANRRSRALEERCELLAAEGGRLRRELEERGETVRAAAEARRTLEQRCAEALADAARRGRERREAERASAAMEREELLGRLAELDYQPAVLDLEVERVAEENYVLACGLEEKQEELARKEEELTALRVHLKKKGCEVEELIGELKRAAEKIVALTNEVAAKRVENINFR